MSKLLFHGIGIFVTGFISAHVINSVINHGVFWQTVIWRVWGI